MSPFLLPPPRGGGCGGCVVGVDLVSMTKDPPCDMHAPLEHIYAQTNRSLSLCCAVTAGPTGSASRSGGPGYHGTPRMVLFRMDDVLVCRLRRSAAKRKQQLGKLEKD